MISFDNCFVRDLPADTETRNFVRQVSSSCYSFCQPSLMALNTDQHASAICINEELANQLGFDNVFLQSQMFIDVFSGKELLDGMQPYAMCYGGHQFGQWAGQLGDGRAINLGEVKTNQSHQTLQLKGSGMTPYSRHADGLAVLHSSIREYLCSEAMFHLGVPTTRALSLMLTGDQIERDMFYDGNPALEKGAVVCRVAPSFIRFGSFEIFTARNDFDSLKKLVDFCIKHDFIDSSLNRIENDEERYLAWFEEIVKRSCDLVLHWQRVGFVHGVMNTDNMSILGLTIDYGPYGWIDDYDPKWTPNTTDLPGRRYCFDNQAKIVHWNLFQLAQALLPLIKNKAALQRILNAFPEKYEQEYLMMMAKKLGLPFVQQEFVTELEQLMHLGQMDMTLFYRLLADFPVNTSVEVSVNSKVKNGLEYFQTVFYENEDIDLGIDLKFNARFQQWLDQYQQQVNQAEISHVERKQSMDKVNPWFVLRNYLSQQAIEAAENNDFSILNDLLEALKKPYQEQEKFAHFAKKRPDWAKYKAGCSMLSCSS